MPKVRQTCTRCSMRRQKCDRKLPCTRCVRDNQAESCSLEWPEGYNPRIHRKYPNPTNGARIDSTRNSEISKTGHQNDDTDTIGDEMSRPTPIYSSPPTSDQTPSLSPRTNRRTSADFGMLLTSVNPYEPGNSSQLVQSSSLADPPDEPLGTDEDSFMAEDYPIPPSVARGGSEQELIFLQSLVPSSRRMQQLVDYHDANLFWFHNGLNLSVFRRDLSAALQTSAQIEIRNHDLRWCALLFAVMAASLTCANVSSVRSWGFDKRQRCILSKQWYEAVKSCLRLGYYASRHHMYSIQAIEVGGVFAHILGFSNEQFVLYGAAYRIAQSLGLQKLAVDATLGGPDTPQADSTQSQQDLLIKRETGRKVWIGLCTQDWFSIASSDMYCLHKKQFTTSKPRRFDDETMLLAGDQVPLGVDFGNYMYDIASMMADFHDATATLEDVSDHYDMVLKYDSRLRALGPESCLPPALLKAAGQPPWVAWARHTCVILHAHKLIMMHRRFLSRSFTNSRFAYTRWASAASAKKILKEIESATSDSQMPAIWSCQVHLVAAGITLCLDHLHHLETEPGFAESRELVDRTISVLKNDESVLSSRGVQLLSTLLAGGKPKPSAPIPCPVHGPPCLGHSESSWPFEITPGLDPSWVQRQVQDGFACPHADGDAVAGQQDQDSGPRAPVPYPEPLRFPGQILLPEYQHHSFTMDPQGLDGNILAPDMSFFDLFTEYYPTLSGFDNPSVFGDLFR